MTAPTPPFSTLRPNNHDRLLLTINETADALNLSLRQTQKLLPEMRTIRIGRRRLVPLEELLRWIAARTA